MEFIVEIASVPYRDGLVAEICYDSEMVAEVHRSNSSSELEIEIYYNSASNWKFDVEDFFSAVKSAKTKLID